VVSTAPSPQTRDGRTWSFSRWSDGGAQTHTVVTGTQDTAYIATYTAPK
jgi:hypothetical protein